VLLGEGTVGVREVDSTPSAAWAISSVEARPNFAMAAWTRSARLSSSSVPSSATAGCAGGADDAVVSPSPPRILSMFMWWTKVGFLVLETNGLDAHGILCSCRDRKISAACWIFILPD